MKGKYVKSVEGGGGGLSEYITPLLAWNTWEKSRQTSEKRTEAKYSWGGYSEYRYSNLFGSRFWRDGSESYTIQFCKVECLSYVNTSWQQLENFTEEPGRES
jgi:hypothetical protein